MSDNSDDYTIGYGKPPRHTRFKPGQSGNPKGRPRKTRNFKTDLQEELQAMVTVSEGGQTQTISRQQAMIKRAVEKALKGELRAIQLLAQWVGTHLAEEPDLLASQPLATEDLALLARHGLLSEDNPRSASQAQDEDTPGGDDHDE